MVRSSSSAEVVVDPLTDAVLGHSLVAATREMGFIIKRSSRSTIVRESEDFSSAVLDPAGSLVAQAEAIPLHMNSIQTVFSGCLRRYPTETWRPGQRVVVNDPYSGGQHLPDLFVFEGIWLAGELLGFVGCIAHHNDVGGSAGSLNPNASDIHEEGLRIPPIRIEDGPWHESEFGELLLANTRTPQNVLADLSSQFSALRLGSQRIAAAAARYGAPALRRVMAQLLENSDRSMRALLTRMPDGEYTGHDYLDSDGHGGDPVEIVVKVTIHGDSATIDFTGTAAQAPGFVNATYSSMLSGVYTAVRCIVDDPTIPTNEGFFRPIEVIVPPGTVLNPNYPAAIRSRMNAACRAYDAVLMALTKAAPGQGAASGFDTTTCVNLSYHDEDGYKILIDPLRGGLGATMRSDGASVVSQILSNSRNTPAEAVEAQMPFLRVLEYSIARGSGGRGRHTGGHGAVRAYEVLCDGVKLNYSSDRQRIAAWGIEGGEPGRRGKVELIRGEQVIALPFTGGEALLRAGDIVRVQTGGGGGFGEPESDSNEETG